MIEGRALSASVFNTPLECGLRSASLLLSSYPARCDLQRLVQYDYLIVHSGDVEGGPTSIHPATPHRSGELLLRRSLVESGLGFMTRKGVIDRAFSGEGIVYSAGEYAAVFLNAMSAAYILSLRNRADWVIMRFQAMTDFELTSFMQARWSLWGAEFVRESLFEINDE